MAPLRCAAKFDPFLSLDCAPTPSTPAQSKERKGLNFAIWQPCPQPLLILYWNDWYEWNFHNLQIWSFFDILVQKRTQHYTLKRAPPSVETPFTMHACFLEFIAAALRVFLLAPFRWVCDYHKDCEGGEDEYDCRK